jgi:hypothetical protein
MNNLKASFLFWWGYTRSNYRHVGTCDHWQQFLELLELDGRGVDLPVGDIEGGKVGLIPNGFRVYEEAPEVLAFEQFVVVLVRVGGVVEEDQAKVPLQGIFLFRLAHLID